MLVVAILVSTALAVASITTDEPLYEISDYEQVLVKNNEDLANATNAEVTTTLTPYASSVMA